MIVRPSLIVAVTPFEVNAFTTTGAGVLTLFKGDPSRAALSVSVFRGTAVPVPPHATIDCYIMPGQTAADGVGLVVREDNSPLNLLRKDFGGAVSAEWKLYVPDAGIQITAISYRFRPDFAVQTPQRVE